MVFADGGLHDATYTLAAPLMASLLLIEQPFRGAFGGFVQHAPFLILTLILCGICNFSLMPASVAVVRARREMARVGACR